jgi:tetratricopeptide (TPR) repeat protein
VANENRKNLLELLKDLAVYITEIITFINTVVNFIKVLRGDMRLVTMVALVLSMVFGLLACLYVRFRRRETGEILGYIDNKPRKVTVPYYPEWARSLALVGLVVIPLLAASGVGYYFYQQARPPHKIIILIANFDGPEPEKYRVTETVLARLRAALERYRDLQVEALGRAITEQEGKEAARAEGEKRKAAIVIWGWYGVTKEVVPISVTFELLRPPKYMPELGPEAKGMVRTMAVAELESFTLQTRLSEEMTYLSLFTVGMARYAREDWDGAIACFSDALSQTAEPMRALDQSIIYFYRGNAYTSKGDYDRAVADYNQAIDRAHELKLDFVEAYVNRGVAYANKGDYDRAISDFDQAIRLKPDLAEAYNNRGNAYAAKGDYDRAISDYDQAIRLKPDYAEAYNNRGLAYYHKGDYDRAIADYNQAIRLKPDYAEAYNNRGLAYYHKGDYDRAIADYNQAIRLKPDYAGAYHNRGVFYAEKGDYDQAIADYNQAIRLKPDLAEAYYGRGLAYKLKGEKEKAIADFRKFLELSHDPYWRRKAEEHLRELGAR